MTSADRNEVKSFVKAVRIEHDKKIKAAYVAKEDGMSLCSDTEITRLAGMETGAQVNKIESVSIKGGLAGSIDTQTKVLTLNLDDYAKKADVSSAMKYKGSKDTFAELPVTGNENGDVWNIKIAGGTDRHGVAIKAGDNVAYVVDENNANETGWDVQGGTTDLSGYLEVDYFNDNYKTALDDLISGSEETFTAEDIASIFDDEEESGGE